MKIYYDVEFLEDGRTIDLISIAAVAEDGREFYAVSDAIEYDPLRSKIQGHHWLMEHVVPHLPLRSGNQGYRALGQFGGFFSLDDQSNVVMPTRMIRNAVRAFILETPDPELWAWYGAYDHVALCQLFGRMVDLPDGIPMWTNDLRQEWQRLGRPSGLIGLVGGPEHNALADARTLRDRAEWLSRYEKSLLNQYLDEFVGVLAADASELTTSDVQLLHGTVASKPESE